MKKQFLLLLFFFSAFCFTVSAQKAATGEQFGKTLNLGLGIGGYSGYYGYVGRSLPVFHINYEFDVAHNFTLAPFVTFYSYHTDYYRETVIPIGLKGTYYFDQLLEADSRWDFYLAGSLGFAIVNSRWDDNYNGNKDKYKYARPLFLDLHIGTEFHISQKLGLFLDLTTGVSTIGIAIH